jgi:serine-type D-Ala-D-Ala carboxypeptidase/endopeptidase (penicillin-binding protein 4)
MKRTLLLSLAAVSSIALADVPSALSPSAVAPATAPATMPIDAKVLSIVNRLQHTGAIAAVRVLDADTGVELVSQDADRAMIPASNMKLVTSAVALTLFGREKQFETNLYLDGQNNLLLVGSGDPGTGDGLIMELTGRAPEAQLAAWADELKAMGVTRINNVGYVDEAFDDEQIHFTWGTDDLPYWYAAPIASLNFNNNCVEITVTPAAATSQPATLSVYPPVRESVQLVNRTMTVATTQPTVDVERQVIRPVFIVTGDVTKRVELRSRPVNDPALFFADALREHLTAKGIAVDGKLVRQSMPTKTDDLRQLKPATTEIARVMGRVNKQSQNQMAEGLAKLAGREFARQQGRDVRGSWAEANTAAKAMLDKMNIESKSLVLADGSGLSRDNRVTARMLSDLLLAMHKRSDFPTFYDSLSIAGVDGTTAGRFKDLPGRVHAKTGFIGGVRSFSGYVRTDSGKLVIFSILFNNIPGTVRPYEQLQDEAVRAILGQY